MAYLLFRLKVVGRSSLLVSVLFREALSHPYISFFHLLVNCFSVTYCIRDSVFSEKTHLKKLMFDFEFIARNDGLWWTPEI